MFNFNGWSGNGSRRGGFGMGGGTRGQNPFMSGGSELSNPFGSLAPTPVTPTRSPLSTPFAGNTMATPSIPPTAPTSSAAAAQPLLPAQNGDQFGGNQVYPLDYAYQQRGSPPSPNMPINPLAAQGASGPVNRPFTLGAPGVGSMFQQQIDRLTGQYGALPAGMDLQSIINAQRGQGLNTGQVLQNIRNLYSQQGANVPRQDVMPTNGLYRPL